MSEPTSSERAPTRLRSAGPSAAGASILPSLFTTGNLFLGFWAIVKAFDGQYGEAAPLIGGAIVLDMLDGRIARLTGTTSEFGAELDSLADAISFGVAPALLAYRWALDEIPRLGWLAAFLFAMCGVLRLARFNVQKHAVDGRYFVGLPIPAAAGQLAAVIAFAPARVTGWVHGLFALLLVIALALLMVSTLRYRSFKGVDLRRRRSYLAVLGIALALHLRLLPTSSTRSWPWPASTPCRRRAPTCSGWSSGGAGTPPPAAVAAGEAR